MCSSSLKYGFNQILFTVEIITVSALLLLNMIAVNSQSTSSPCPNIFNYQFNADTAEYYGLVQVPSPPLGSTLHLIVNLTLNARLPTVSFVCKKKPLIIFLLLCDISDDERPRLFSNSNQEGEEVGFYYYSSPILKNVPPNELVKCSSAE